MTDSIRGISGAVLVGIKSFLADSNQGECAELLTRNELGSIPRLPANVLPHQGWSHTVDAVSAGFESRWERQRPA